MFQILNDYPWMLTIMSWFIAPLITVLINLFVYNQIFPQNRFKDKLTKKVVPIIKDMIISPNNATFLAIQNTINRNATKLNIPEHIVSNEYILDRVLHNILTDHQISMNKRNKYLITTTKLITESIKHENKTLAHSKAITSFRSHKKIFEYFSFGISSTAIFLSFSVFLFAFRDILLLTTEDKILNNLINQTVIDPIEYKSFVDEYSWMFVLFMTIFLLMFLFNFLQLVLFIRKKLIHRK
jgi:hypothetical protein